MSSRVLVVDDSSFFRKTLSDVFNSDPYLTVVGTANNGAEAIEMVDDLVPDVITMDIEMPVMDGITAVKEIKKKHDMPILMFSSYTQEGAQVTLDALEAGAVDFLPKSFDELSTDRSEAERLLQMRVRILAATYARAEKNVQKSHATQIPSAAHGQYDVLLIGGSTGGPMALREILSAMPADFPVPIVIIQHMPETFTPAFAERLNQICALEVHEAVDGDKLAPGRVFVVPGGQQLMFKGSDRSIHIHQGEEQMAYKPSVDVTFASAAKVFGSRVLGLVITGMGSDGADGASLLKSQGSTIWVQDEESSVVHGMPNAVLKAGSADEVINLSEISDSLIKECG